jgi:hypothetical protein
MAEAVQQESPTGAACEEKQVEEDEDEDEEVRDELPLPVRLGFAYLRYVGAWSVAKIVESVIVFQARLADWSFGDGAAMEN